LLGEKNTVRWLKKYGLTTYQFFIILAAIYPSACSFRWFIVLKALFAGLL
jgi:hypothetical protein